MRRKGGQSGRNSVTGVPQDGRKRDERIALLANALSKGKRSMFLYPPDMEVCRKSSQTRQVKHSEYYIDLSFDDEDTRLQFQIEKAKKLLKAD